MAVLDLFSQFDTLKAVAELRKTVAYIPVGSSCPVF